MSIGQSGMNASHAGRGVLCGWNLAKAVTAVILFSAAAPVAFAYGVGAAPQGGDASSFSSLGAAFTFLFVTLGPLNVISPFAAMTNGRDVAFKRRLAFRAVLIAAIALVVAATVGVKTLQSWGISVGILLLAGGVILFLVALQQVLAGYNPHGPQAQGTPAAAVPAPSEFELALSPLAFPTIITPYGLALLILLFTLYPLGSGGWWILATAAFVLALDLLAMLCADLITSIPFSKAGLDILGAVMGVLLVALGIQAAADGVRLLAETKF